MDAILANRPRIDALNQQWTAYKSQLNQLEPLWSRALTLDTQLASTRDAEAMGLVDKILRMDMSMLVQTITREQKRLFIEIRVKMYARS